MKLHTSAWKAKSEKQSNFIVIESDTSRIYNLVEMPTRREKTVYGGWGVEYEETGYVDPRTETAIMRIRREGTSDWRDEYCRLDSDSLFWKTTNSSSFYEWLRIDITDIPVEPIKHLERIRLRMSK